MDFSVNNNGIQKVDTLKKREDNSKKQADLVQGEDRDYSSAYSALGAASMAQFQAAQKIQKASMPQGPITPDMFKDGKAFLDSLVQEPNLDKKEINDYLLSIGCTQEQIDQFRDNNPSFFDIAVNAFRLHPDNFTAEDIEKFCNEEINQENEDVFLKLYKLVNKDNIQIIKEKFNIEDDKEASETLFNLLNILFENGELDYDDFNQKFSRALGIYEATNEKFLDILDFVDSYSCRNATLEHVKAQRLLSDILGKEFNIRDCISIEDPSKVTPEFAEQYKKALEDFATLNIKPSERITDPVAMYSHIKSFNDLFKTAGVDFSWYKNYLGENNVPVRHQSVSKIVKSENPKAGVEFIKLCSDKAKEKHADTIVSIAASERLQQNPKGYSELINTMSDTKASEKEKYYYYNLFISFDDLWRHSENDTDPSALAKLIKMFDKYECYPGRYDLKPILQFKGANAENAVKCIDLLNEMYGESEHKKNIIGSQIQGLSANTNYENMLKVLSVLRNSGYDEQFLGEILRDDFDYENAQKSLLKIQENGIASLVTPKVLQGLLDIKGDYDVDKLKTLISLGADGTSIAKVLPNIALSNEIIQEKVGKYITALKDKYPDVKNMDDMLVWTIVSNGKNTNPDDVLQCSLSRDEDSIRYYKNKLTMASPQHKNLIKNLWANGEVEKVKQLSLLNDIVMNKPMDDSDTRENIINFVEELYLSDEYNFDLENARIMASNLKNDSSLDLAKRLIKNKNLNMDNNIIARIVGDVKNEYCVDLVERLCTDETLNPPKDVDTLSAIAFTVTDVYSKKLAEKLCTDKELNFPKEQIVKFINSANITNDDSLKFVEDYLLNKEYAVPCKLMSDIMSALKDSTDAGYELAKQLLADKTFPREDIPKAMKNIHIHYESNVPFIKELLDDVRAKSGQDEANYSPVINIAEALMISSKVGAMDFVKQLWFESDISKEDIADIAKSLNNSYYSTLERRYDFAEKLCFGEDFNIPKEYVADIIQATEYNESKLEVAKDLCFDPNRKIRPDLIADVITFVDTPEKLSFAERLSADESFTHEIVYPILNRLYQRDYIIPFAEKLCNDEDFPKKLIPNILDVINDKNRLKIAEQAYGNENISNELLLKIMETCHCESALSIAEQICTENKFSDNVKKEIISAVGTSDAIDLAKEICSDDSFLPQYIPDIVRHSGKECQKKLALALCKDKDFPKDKIANLISVVNDTNYDVAEMVLFDESNAKNIPQITRFLEQINNQNKTKMKSIAESPKLLDWALKNSDLPVDTLIGLARTQRTLYNEAVQKAKKDAKIAAKQMAVADKQIEVVEAKSADIQRAEQALVDIGVHPNMAASLIKKCQKNGIVDRNKLETLCKMAPLYESVNKKGQKIINVNFNDMDYALRFAAGNAASGENNGKFRMEIIDDIVKCRQCGIDDNINAVTLASLKNMSAIEFKCRLNKEALNNLLVKLDSLDESTRAKLIEAGFDLPELREKVTYDKAPKVKINKELTPKSDIVTRSYDSIDGAEKIVLNRFKKEVPQETWANPEAFHKWAEEKIDKIANVQNDFELIPEFTATGDYSRYNESRKTGIKNWYTYIKEKSSCKDDIFTQLLVLDGVTRELSPDNAAIPPSISEQVAEEAINAVSQENSNVSFTEAYTEQLKSEAIRRYGKEPKTVDGVYGQWVTIPQSQKDEPNYDEHIAMVQALADGSSWCLRFENAHSYLQGNDVHYFLDADGKAQTAIAVDKYNNITELQKRYNQNGTVPVPYAVVIDEWAKENNYTGRESQRKDALAAKPKFEKLKAELSELMAKGDILRVFAELGINVYLQPDGTYRIGTYDPKYCDQYTIPELGVDETKLFENVSEVDGILYLEGSSLKSAPKLRNINSYINFADCSINDLRSLEKIGRETIYWDKT